MIFSESAELRVSIYLFLNRLTGCIPAFRAISRRRSENIRMMLQVLGASLYELGNSAETQYGRFERLCIKLERQSSNELEMKVEFQPTS